MVSQFWWREGVRAATHSWRRDFWRSGCWENFAFDVFLEPSDSGRRAVAERRRHCGIERIQLLALHYSLSVLDYEFKHIGGIFTCLIFGGRASDATVGWTWTIARRRCGCAKAAVGITLQVFKYGPCRNECLCRDSQIEIRRVFLYILA